MSDQPGNAPACTHTCHPQQGHAARTWIQALLRGIALGLALAVHLGLLAILLLPPAAMRPFSRRAVRRDHAIDVRLIDARPEAPSPRLPSWPRSAAPQQHLTRAAMHRARPHGQSAASAAHMPQRRPLRLEPLRTGTRQVPAFVAGGGFVQHLQQARRAPVAPALPGSDAALVPGLHMADPRSQGLAGAVRLIGGIFGAENPHCVDVDAWQRMTPRELAARDLTPDSVRQIAEQNDCLAQKPEVPDHIDFHPGGPTH